MTLLEYVQTKKINHNDLATAIGVTRPNVRLWVMRVTTPGLYHALRIKDYTKGKVLLHELLSLVDGDRYDKN